MSAERVTPSRMGIRRSNSILTSCVGFDALDAGSSARTGAAAGQEQTAKEPARRRDGTNAWDARIDHSTGKSVCCTTEETVRGITEPIDRRRAAERHEDRYHAERGNEVWNVDYHRGKHAGSMVSRFWGIAHGFDVD